MSKPSPPGSDATRAGNGDARGRHRSRPRIGQRSKAAEAKEVKRLREEDASPAKQAKRAAWIAEYEQIQADTAAAAESEREEELAGSMSGYHRMTEDARLVADDADAMAELDTEHADERAAERAERLAAEEAQSVHDQVVRALWRGPMTIPDLARRVRVEATGQTYEQTKRIDKLRTIIQGHADGHAPRFVRAERPEGSSARKGQHWCLP